MRKGKDPDPRGPKTCGSGSGSISPTLVWIMDTLMSRKIIEKSNIFGALCSKVDTYEIM
jgi:hypothetical protein